MTLKNMSHDNHATFYRVDICYLNVRGLVYGRKLMHIWNLLHPLRNIWIISGFADFIIPVPATNKAKRNHCAI